MGGTIYQEQLLVAGAGGLAKGILGHIKGICLAATNHQQRLVNQLHIVGGIKDK